MAQEIDPTYENFNAPKIYDFLNPDNNDPDPESYFREETFNSNITIDEMATEEVMVPEQSTETCEEETDVTDHMEVDTAAPQTPHYARKTASRAAYFEQVAKKAGAENEHSGISHYTLKLTEPKTPNLHTKERKRSAREISTEQRWLQQIEAHKAEVERLKKVNAANVHKVLQNHGQTLPARSVKPLTTPVEFNFHTEKRTREMEHPMALRTTPQRMSRENHPWVPKLTEPVPFHFKADERCKSAASENVTAWKSLAARVEEFSRKTPERFRTKPAEHVDTRPLTLTKPEPFNLSTAGRERSHKELSTAEREMQELANVQPFKARPLNPKIMESCGDLGVPKVSKVPLTEPQEFHFAVDDRLGNKKRKQSVDEEENTNDSPKGFKARKLNEKILVEPDFVPALPHKHTEPLGFDLETDRRGARTARKQEDSDDTSNEHFKARPMPDGAPFQVRPSHRPLTEPVGFPLKTEERGAGKVQEMLSKLEKEQKHEREARRFKAQPMPDVIPMEDGSGFIIKPDLVPQPSNRPLTEPVGFNLRSVQRSEAARADWAHKVEAELEAEMHQFSSFKAQPTPQTTHEPFIVKKSTKPLTEVTDFQLNSDRRADVRHEFEARKAEREAEKDAMRRQAVVEKREAELREVAEIRKSMQFRAKPILRTKPMDVKPSERVLTEPHSPALQTRKRASSRVL
eukprot:GILK01002145.1.p1 GENE.GILK01002145.1~~GILK01002145.1.p1  ORF type:complete len:714 (-),score=130.71 GILK01002145.1:182-2245(-)